MSGLATNGSNNLGAFVSSLELADAMLDARDKPEQNLPKSTGFTNLDRFWKIRRGELTVVTGVPSHGKSTFLDQIAVNRLLAEGARWAFASYEALPPAVHFETLAEQIVGQGFRYMSNDQFNRAMCLMADKIFLLSPGEDGWDDILDSLLASFWILHKSFGLEAVVIDPWNCLDHSRNQEEQGLNETEYVSRCLTKMKKFAVEAQVHFFLVAHPRKLFAERRGDPVPVPEPYDISGSAHFYNKADNCITVYRAYSHDPKNDPVEIHVQKVKFKKVGCRGMQEFDFDWKCSRYKEKVDLLTPTITTTRKDLI